MEMVVRSMEMAEMAMETDGDGSGGTSLSRQGVGTETSVPRNLSLTVAVLSWFHQQICHKGRGMAVCGRG
jgi:hypothetical protein